MEWTYNLWGQLLLVVVIWIVVLVTLAKYNGNNKTIKIIKEKYLNLMKQHKILYWLVVLVLPLVLLYGIEYMKHSYCVSKGYEINESLRTRGRGGGFRCVDTTDK